MIMNMIAVAAEVNSSCPVPWVPGHALMLLLMHDWLDGVRGKKDGQVFSQFKGWIEGEAARFSMGWSICFGKYYL